MTDVTGFIGAGNMGASLVKRFAASGRSAHVLDVDPARAEALAGPRVTVASDLVELAAKCQALVLCLPGRAASSATIDALLRDPGQVAVVIEASTVGADAVRGARERLAAAGIDLLDAPVSGGPRGRTLTAMIAGNTRARALGIDTVRTFADRLIDCGPAAGAAQTAKLVNNALSLGTLALASEVVAEGVRQGVDAATLIQAINAGSGRCAVTEEKFPRSILTGSFDYGATIGIAAKDMELFLSTCGGTEATATRSLAALWQEALSRFGAEADFTSIYRLFGPAPETKAGQPAAT